MDESLLRYLIAGDENPCVEFKQEIYWMLPKGEQRRCAKDECAKDILTLANGNCGTVASFKYLIVGVGDMRDPQLGTRQLFSLEEPLPTSDDLLQLVNERCAPRIEQLLAEPMILDGHRLLVITIPPSPHVHQTTKMLTTKPHKQDYSPNTIFIRIGSQTRQGTSHERARLKRAKDHHFLPPKQLKLGWILSIILMCVSLITIALGNTLHLPTPTIIGYTIASFGVTFLAGGGLIFLHREYMTLAHEWTTYTTQQRGVYIGIFITTTFLAWMIGWSFLL